MTAFRLAKEGIDSTYRKGMFAGSAQQYVKVSLELSKCELLLYIISFKSR